LKEVVKYDSIHIPGNSQYDYPSDCTNIFSIWMFREGAALHFLLEVLHNDFLPVIMNPMNHHFQLHGGLQGPAFLKSKKVKLSP
jgi:hypothetical protein